MKLCCAILGVIFIKGAVAGSGADPSYGILKPWDPETKQGSLPKGSKVVPFWAVPCNP